MDESQQEHVLKSSLDRISSQDTKDVAELATQAAKAAFEVMFQVKFGAIYGSERSIVYSNMGPTNLHLLNVFVAEVENAGVQVLAHGVWSADEPYSFAVIIDDGDADRWRDILVKLWVAGNEA